ncbi:MAG: hypothetical protein GX811_02420 [Lentisphaerae bacterium]|jgi:hypothetical protein|nr:hypothetical protein [Lentisphaerota bacterium]
MLSVTMIGIKIKKSIATADGKTVQEVLRNRGIVNTVWFVEHGDWRGLEGKAYVACFSRDGTTEVFVWQWDSAWPHALALTPNTAKIFPLMDPGVELTPSGQSSLWSGKSGAKLYFEKRTNIQ